MRGLLTTLGSIVAAVFIAPTHCQLYGRRLLIPTNNGGRPNDLLEDGWNECALGEAMAPLPRGGYHCVDVEPADCVQEFDWDGSCRNQEQKFGQTDGGRRAYVCGVKESQKEILCCQSVATKLKKKSTLQPGKTTLVELCQPTPALYPDISSRECRELKPTTPRPDEPTTKYDCGMLTGDEKKRCLQMERRQQWLDEETRKKKIAGTAVRSTGILLAKNLPPRIFGE